MALFNPISESVSTTLIKRLRDEYSAHFLYTDAANWCNNNGYTNAEKYFRGEAESELTHALKLQAFLNNWGVAYRVERPATTYDFSSLAELINLAYDIEVRLYEAYNSNAIEFMIKDSSAYQLALEMVNIQYESVAEYRTLKDKMRHYDMADRFQVAMFENETFE